MTSLLRCRSLLLYLILGCGLSAHAQQGSSSSSFTISGTVVNSVSGEPIRGALVQVVSGMPDAVLTDGDGRFQFDDQPNPQASLIAHKPGFLNDADTLAINQSQSFPAQVRPQTGPVVIKLTPQGVISGRVLDETGEPIEDLPVKLIYVHIVDGRKRWEQRSTTVTNPEGAFRFADLTPGSYYVKAGPSAVAAFISRHEDAFGAVFYPSPPGVAGASPLHVGVGERVEADFSLKSEPVYKVSGVVAGLAEGQGAGLQVMDEFGDVVPAPIEMGPGAGSFQLRVPGGRYFIRAWVQGADRVQRWAEQTLRVQSDMNNLRLVPVTSAVIPVAIRTEFSNKSLRVLQAAGRPFQAATVRLVPQGPALAGSDVYAGTRFVPGQPAELAFQNVPPGKYELAINPNGNWYVQSARMGDVDALQDELNIPSGGSLPPLEIVLRDDGGSLTGTVQADGPETWCQVIVVPDSNRSQVRTQTIGTGAQFDFSNLAPDGYSVFALNSAEGLQYAEVGALDSYLGNAAHVVVPAHGQQSVKVNLTRAGSQ
ncbi:MAG TPA: carboxypeptidase regulatory-like domain-containing protein [Terriglobales bacterium]|nr:carboxypeptidase regulatory-like domain-containing protein [Terriglobales bacterium]